ncbi:MAG: type II toxin-antitoxin system VapC family toxin [Verrucomicrobiaceae bacterium]|nr:type II toxin-antitoxin system VapC family toxin [Verrucomicrobiaceae bacterium]
MKPYADTNLLTRLYLRLPETPAASALIHQAANAGDARPPITRSHRVEFANALEIHVFLGRQGGHVRVTPEQSSAAHAWFSGDLAEQDLFIPVALDPDDVVCEAQNLSLRHTAKHGFRTYDVMHVAAALMLGCDVFWTFDAKARQLAALEGKGVN